MIKLIAMGLIVVLTLAGRFRWGWLAFIVGGLSALADLLISRDMPDAWGMLLWPLLCLSVWSVSKWARAVMKMPPRPK